MVVLTLWSLPIDPTYPSGRERVARFTAGQFRLQAEMRSVPVTEEGQRTRSGPFPSVTLTLLNRTIDHGF